MIMNSSFTTSPNSSCVSTVPEKSVQLEPVFCPFSSPAENAVEALVFRKNQERRREIQRSVDVAIRQRKLAERHERSKKVSQQSAIQAARDLKREERTLHASTQSLPFSTLRQSTRDGREIRPLHLDLFREYGLHLTREERARKNLRVRFDLSHGANSESRTSDSPAGVSFSDDISLDLSRERAEVDELRAWLAAPPLPAFSRPQSSTVFHAVDDAYVEYDPTSDYNEDYTLCGLFGDEREIVKKTAAKVDRLCDEVTPLIQLATAQVGSFDMSALNETISSTKQVADALKKPAQVCGAFLDPAFQKRLLTKVGILAAKWLVAGFGSWTSVLFDLITFVDSVTNAVSAGLSYIGSLLHDRIADIVELVSSFFSSEQGSTGGDGAEMTLHVDGEVSDPLVSMCSVVSTLVFGLATTGASAASPMFSKVLKTAGDVGRNVSGIERGATTIFTHVSKMFTRLAERLTLWQSGTTLADIQVQIDNTKGHYFSYNGEPIDVGLWFSQIQEALEPDNQIAVCSEEWIPRHRVLLNQCRVLETAIFNKQLEDKRIGREGIRLISMMTKRYRDFHNVNKLTLGASHDRDTPFCLYMVGGSGVGKSFLTKRLIKDITNPENTEISYNHGNLTWYWNPSLKFADNYNQQDITVLDDGFCERGMSAGDSPALQFLRMCSAIPFPMPQASIEKKGMPYSSNVVMVTSNTMHPFPEEINNTVAIHNRRNILVSVYRTKAVNPSDYFDGMMFQRMEPVSPTAAEVKIGEPMTYRQFASYVIGAIEQFEKNKTRFVAAEDFELDNSFRRLGTSNGLKLCVDDEGATAPEIDEGDEELAHYFGYTPEEFLSRPPLERAAAQEAFDRLTAAKNVRQLVTVSSRKGKNSIFRRIDVPAVVILVQVLKVAGVLLAGYGLSRLAMSAVTKRKCNKGYRKAREQFGEEYEAEIRRNPLYARVPWKLEDHKHMMDKTLNAGASASGDYTTRKAVRTQARQVIPNAVLHVDDDTNAFEVDNRLISRQLVVLAREGGGVNRGLFVQTNLVLTNSHLFLFRKAERYVLRFRDAMGSDKLFEVFHEDIAFLSRESHADEQAGLGRDVCMFRVSGGRPVKNLIPHFQTRAQSLKTLAGTMVSFLDANADWDVLTPRRVLAPAKLITADLRFDHDFEFDLKMLEHYRVNGCRTVKGDCGSIVLANDSSRPAKIVGLIYAGAKSRHSTIDVSFAEVLIREEVEELVAELNVPTSERISEIDDRFEVLELRLGTPDRPAVPSVSVLPGACGAVLGVSRFPAAVIPKTSIVPLPTMNVFYSPETAPAVMTIRDEIVDEDVKAAGREVLSLSLDKFMHSVPMYDPRSLARAAAVVRCKMSTWGVSKNLKRILSKDEVLNGISGTMLKRIDLLTSCGVPYKFWVPPSCPGKTAYFKVTNAEQSVEKHHYAFSDRVYKGVNLGEKIEKDYDLRLEELMRGEITPYVFVETLKMERRKFAKLERAATRSFDIAPLDILLTGRALYGGWMAAAMEDPVNNEIAVGIDMMGPDATELRRRLNRFGGNVIAGDHKNWDGNASEQLGRVADEETNHWYKATPKEALARLAWTKSTFHSYHFAANTLLHVQTGMKSGLPTTSPRNSIMNWLLLLTAIIEVCEDEGVFLTTDELLEEVELSVYGDDHVIALSPRLQLACNFFRIKDWFADHGLVYTDASKDDSLEKAFTPLAEASFLKRKFVPLVGTTLYTAALDLTSIHELLNWRKTSNDFTDEEVYAINMDNFHRELFNHGRPVYDQHVAHVNALLPAFREKRASEGKDVAAFRDQPNRYDELLRDFVGKFGMDTGESFSSKA